MGAECEGPDGRVRGGVGGQAQAAHHLLQAQVLLHNTNTQLIIVKLNTRYGT